MLSKTVSSLIQKLQVAPQGYGSEAARQPHPVGPSAPQCGPYFFYGSLIDPTLLSDVLTLSAPPILRPAKVIGYALKLWGQYPALVDAERDDAVEGVLYDLMESKHASRLAEYETSAYWPTPCLIYVRDRENEQGV